jgi:Ca2+-dependent lipid-binding protein
MHSPINESTTSTPRHYHTTTQKQESSRNPEFYNARYFLYVEDLQTATLKVTLKDKNAVGGDDLIGTAMVPLSELFKEEAKGEEEKPKWSGWMDLKVGTGRVTNVDGVGHFIALD